MFHRFLSVLKNGLPDGLFLIDAEWSMKNLVPDSSSSPWTQDFKSVRIGISDFLSIKNLLFCQERIVNLGGRAFGFKNKFLKLQPMNLLLRKKMVGKVRKSIKG